MQKKLIRLIQMLVLNFNIFWQNASFFLTKSSKTEYKMFISALKHKLFYLFHGHFVWFNILATYQDVLEFHEVYDMTMVHIMYFGLDIVECNILGYFAIMRKPYPIPKY